MVPSVTPSALQNAFTQSEALQANALQADALHLSPDSCALDDRQPTQRLSSCDVDVVAVAHASPSWPRVLLHLICISIRPFAS